MTIELLGPLSYVRSIRGIDKSAPYSRPVPGRLRRPQGLASRLSALDTSDCAPETGSAAGCLMDARRRRFGWSLVPLLYIGGVLLLLGAHGLWTGWWTSWLVLPGLATIAATVGVARSRSWGHLLEGAIGLLVGGVVVFLTWLLAGLTLHMGQSFDVPVLLFLGTLLVASGWMIAASVMGLAHRGSPTHAP